MIWILFVLITAAFLSPLGWILRRHQNDLKGHVTFLAVFGFLSIPVLAFSLYALRGSPSLESFPYNPKTQKGPSLSEAIGMAEKRLAENPMDGKGWEVIAPIYFRLGRMEDACQAYEKVTLLLGETASRLADYGEACVFSEENAMSQKTHELFEQALRLDPKSLKAHFYLAQVAQIEGNKEKVLSHLRAIADASPPDAPWMEVMREIFAKMAERVSK